MSSNAAHNDGRQFDLDKESSFGECAARLKSPDTENFAIRFNAGSAKCAVDVSQEEALKWLQPGNRTENQVVWLNFWASSMQKPTIAAIAKKYGLSQRLTGLLCPVRKSAPLSSTSPTATSSGAPTTANGAPRNAPTSDVEKGVSHTSSQAVQSNPKPSGLQGISFSNVVDDLWHFCSVDFGPRYIYVGYNALFSLPSTERRNDNNITKPAGVRVWTSLLICDDGTVISVFEKPTRSEAHKVARRNMLNVFRHLSVLHDQDDAQDSLMKVRVRWNDHSETSGNGYSESEAASLLFYYLFDDWMSTYAMIARLEHPYRDTLEELRKSMFEAAEIDLIKKVHNVGRQLTVLKLMYQSYELIVSRLLYRQRSVRHADLGSLAPMDQGHYHNVARGGDDASTPSMHLQMAQSELMYLDEGSGLGVKLSLSAVVRFERLLDRIKLYALTEIDECLKEKESLVFMVTVAPRRGNLFMLT